MSKPDWKDAPDDAVAMRIAYIWILKDGRSAFAHVEPDEPRPEPVYEYQWSVKMNGEWYVAPIPNGLARPAMLTDAEAEALFNGEREFKRLDWTRRERK